MAYKKRYIILAFFVFSSFFFSVLKSNPLSAYGINYSHYVYATGSDGIPIMGEGSLPGATSYSAQYRKDGHTQAGNYAEVDYYANLRSASLGSLAYAHGTSVPSYPYGYTSTGRVETLNFYDTLYFTVPQGEYPNGVTVGVTGSAYANLFAQVGASAKVRYSVVFGPQNFDSGMIQISNEEDSSILIDEPFILHHEIVAPGTVLPEDRVYPVQIMASISNNRSSNLVFGTPPNHVTGDASVDFHNGLWFTAVITPRGVVWESASGVFLESPVSVPENQSVPETLLLKQNHPNPFNPVTELTYYIASPSKVSIHIHDIKGRLVRRLVEGETVGAGENSVFWDGRHDSGAMSSSGIYFAKVKAGQSEKSIKMTLLK